MENVIDFFLGKKNEIRNVVVDEPKIFVASQVTDIRRITRDQIIHCDHAMSFGQQPIAQMRTQKTGAAGNNGNRSRFFVWHALRYLISEDQARNNPFSGKGEFTFGARKIGSNAKAEMAGRPTRYAELGRQQRKRHRRRILAAKNS